jgi:hypothetical protein
MGVSLSLEGTRQVRGRSRGGQHTRTAEEQACLDALAAFLRSDVTGAGRCLSKLSRASLASRRRALSHGRPISCLPAMLPQSAVWNSTSCCHLPACSACATVRQASLRAPRSPVSMAAMRRRRLSQRSQPTRSRAVGGDSPSRLPFP